MIYASQGLGRYKNIKAVLENIRLPKRKTILKPNLVTGGLAATHIDAVRAVVDSIDIDIIAEGSAVDTGELFSSLGYKAIAKEYGIDLVDINHTSDWNEIEFLDIYGQPQKVRISRLAKEQIISLALPKTHDHAIVTLTLKNMLGFVHPRDRTKVHGYVSLFSKAMAIKPIRKVASHLSKFKVLRKLYSSTEVEKERYILGAKVIHKNLVTLIEYSKPALGVIDGYVGMEGAGPTGGDPVPWDMALAGDPVECDVICTKLMGFNPRKVGYLYYLKAPSSEDIEISCEIIEKKFKPHPKYQLQLMW
jgi:uncharacterized protein (DUF362 family)